MIRITMRSESTLVPPVTDERSPPASRITGADSPVMGRLVHRRYAFDHLAIAGDELTSLHHHTIPGAQVSRGHGVLAAALTQASAGVCVRILRSESACALPRPSATASAKLANTTVIHNQTLIQAVNHSGALRPASRSSPARP